MLVTTLPGSSNLLDVSLDNLQIRSANGTLGRKTAILASAADRRLTLLSITAGFPLLRSYANFQDSPILSCLVLDGGRATITTSMSGQIALHDHATDKTLDQRRDHQKYVVKAVALEDTDGAWLATAGWDAKVLLYRLVRHPAGTYETLGASVAQIELKTNPETLTFAQSQTSDSPVLIVTRRDSTSLHYFQLPPVPKIATGQSPVTLKHLGSQNLVPASNTWVSFSPSSISICPTDPTVLAVATSAVPHMKLIIARLLFPVASASGAPLTQASQTQAQNALQKREESAIIIHSSTLAPQSQYSTPQVTWRPDGTGVWVNGDDGILRGVETKTGKIVATLNNGHEPGSKIRSIWAGWVEGANGKEEWVISGGFDKRLVVWKSNHFRTQDQLRM